MLESIDSPGPAITEADIADLEARIRASLPRDYREFLLEFNGGRPTPDTMDVLGLPDSPTGVQVFHGINATIESECIEWHLDTLALRLEPRIVPIACDSLGNAFCLSLREQDHGSVIY